MFLMFSLFVLMLAGMAALIWLGCQRVAAHLGGKPEATKAVVEHVLMPLFGRKETPEAGTFPGGFDSRSAKEEVLKRVLGDVDQERGRVKKPARVCPEATAMTLEERLTKIEAMLVVLVEGQQVREWYSVDQFARIVGRSEFTCREWCRRGRIEAVKKASGRGAFAAWAISHGELLRYQREGLRRPSSD